MSIDNSSSRSGSVQTRAGSRSSAAAASGDSAVELPNDDRDRDKNKKPTRARKVWCKCSRCELAAPDSLYGVQKSVSTRKMHRNADAERLLVQKAAVKPPTVCPGPAPDPSLLSVHVDTEYELAEAVDWNSAESEPVSPCSTGTSSNSDSPSSANSSGGDSTSLDESSDSGYEADDQNGSDAQVQADQAPIKSGRTGRPPLPPIEHNAPVKTVQYNYLA